MDAKTCTRCGEAKALDSFYRRGGSTSRSEMRHSRCKECHKELAYENRRANRERYLGYHRAWVERQGPGYNRQYILKSVYGITLLEYESLRAKQGGRCAICGRDPVTEGGQNLAIDHDHDTGLIRGLLCTQCNRGMGLLGDSAERLRAAAAYLGADE